MRKTQLPAVLAVTIMAAATSGALLVSSCGGDDQPPQCEVYCVPETDPPAAACAGPDLPCATGTNHDQCPTGCIPEPVV